MTYENGTIPETDTAAAVVAGIELAGPKPLDQTDSERFFTQLVPAGAQLQTLDLLQLEQQLAPYPHRKTGIVHVQDSASFIDYIGKHRLPSTEVFADRARKALVGVINAHEESTPDESCENKAGHGDHRVLLELIHTDAWLAWTGADKKWRTQQEFAEHLEDNSADIVEPDAATMLEIAESFHASMSADFKRAERLHSGVVQLRYEETQTATAGQRGELDIPTAFVLGICPYVGSEPVELIARFRYRIREGNLSLSYALLNPTEVALQAYDAHVDAVRAAIVPPVFLGRPA